jgi:hypothetical protein
VQRVAGRAERGISRSVDRPAGAGPAKPNTKTGFFGQRGTQQPPTYQPRKIRHTRAWGISRRRGVVRIRYLMRSKISHNLTQLLLCEVERPKPGQPGRNSVAGMAVLAVRDRQNVAQWAGIARNIVQRRTHAPGGCGAWRGVRAVGKQRRDVLGLKNVGLGLRNLGLGLRNIGSSPSLD